VHAAVVIGDVLVLIHVGRLRILAQHRIVVSGARSLHGADADAVDVGGEQAGADDPVGLIGGLLELVLLGQCAEDVG